MDDFPRDMVDRELSYTAMSLTADKEKILEIWDEFEDVDMLRDEIKLFIVTAYATIEELTAEIISNHIIEEDFSDQIHDYIYSRMSQSHREQLLNKCGIYDDIFIGHLAEIRALRNKLAHEHKPSLDWEDDRIEDRMDLAINILKVLYYSYPEEEVIKKASTGDGLSKLLGEDLF